MINFWDSGHERQKQKTNRPVSKRTKNGTAVRVAARNALAVKRPCLRRWVSCVEESRSELFPVQRWFPACVPIRSQKRERVSRVPVCPACVSAHGPDHPPAVSAQKRLEKRPVLGCRGAHGPGEGWGHRACAGRAVSPCAGLFVLAPADTHLLPHMESRR